MLLLLKKKSRDTNNRSFFLKVSQIGQERSGKLRVLSYFFVSIIEKLNDYTIQYTVKVKKSCCKIRAKIFLFFFKRKGWIKKVKRKKKSGKKTTGSEKKKKKKKAFFFSLFTRTEENFFSLSNLLFGSNKNVT